MYNMAILKLFTNDTSDFFENERSELERYGDESIVVENEVRSAIRSLEMLNSEINESLLDIADKKALLDATEKEMISIKEKNIETIKKYSALFDKAEEEDKSNV